MASHRYRKSLNTMNNITLIGMMGSGKSTIAKELKDIYEYDIIDTDSSIEKEQNMTISDIFKEMGEEYFRKLEYDFISNISASENHIISTGGGIVLNPLNVVNLKKISTVVYLKGTCETLISRLTDETEKRPLLQKDKLRKNLEIMLNDRSDLYENASDLTINIEGKDVSQIALEIYKRLK